MRYLTFLSLVTFLLSLPLQTQALPALYEAEVEVPDQGRATRTEGMSQAMAAVLLKVSGNRRVAEEESLAEALQQPARFVQQYSYRTEEEEEQERLLLHVRFDPRGIDELLHRSGINVWGDARPSTLIWLGVEDGGRRVLVGDNDRGLVRGLVEREAARRALPVKLPKMDSRDLKNVRPADVWGEFFETVKEASERYAPHAILMGRIYPVSAGRWESRWSLDYRGEVVRWEFRSAAVGPLIADAIDRVTDQLVSRLTQSYVGGSGELLLRVEGVHNLKDYRRVFNYLKGTRGVKQVVAETMTPKTVRLRVVTDGGIEPVLQTIAIGRTLTKVSQPVATALPRNQAVRQNSKDEGAGKYSFSGNTTGKENASELPVDEPPQQELVYRLMP